MAKLKVSPRQRLLVAEYLKDFNGTQAAIRVGYSPRSAGEVSSRILALPRVRELVEAKLRRMEREAEISTDLIVRELRKIGFANMDDFMKVGEDGLPFPDFGALDRYDKAALAEVSVDTFTERAEDSDEEARVVKRVKFKLGDKRAALVDMLKHLGGQFRATSGEQEQIVPKIEITGGLPE